MTFRFARRATAGALAKTLAAATLAAAVAGCSLDVETPGIVDPDNLADETSLPTLLAGARGDFGVAYAGDDGAGDEGMILVGGLRADEFLNRDTFEQRRDIDVGTARPDNASLVDLFRNTQRARRSAEFTADRFGEFAPDDPGFAEALNLAAYTAVFLGEVYCPGVPFSNLDASNQFVYGEQLTREATFQRALAKFDSALAIATAAGTGSAATAQANLARVGRGRVLLNLGQFAQAAAAVAAVPTSFSYAVEYSENTSRQNNAVFTFNNVRRRWGVADNEGVNGLPFFSAADPRVPVTRSTRNGLDGENVRILNQGKYPARTTSIPLADGREARLIEAEAALQAGNAATALATLNTLRAGSSLAALTDAGTAAGRETQLFRERAFWLFGTNHRLGDLRRLLRAPYSRPYASVFPQGQYFKQGRIYGTQPSLPLPIEEENNPNFEGCLAED